MLTKQPGCPDQETTSWRDIYGKGEGIYSTPLQRQIQYLVWLLHQHTTHVATDTWLQPHKKPALCTLSKRPPYSLKIHTPCPNLQRPTILQDRTAPGTQQKSLHQTCLSRKHTTLGESEKSLSLTTPLQPLGFHSLQTKEAEIVEN